MAGPCRVHWLGVTPPIPPLFGDPGLFWTWGLLKIRHPPFAVQSVLPDILKEAAVEVAPYFLDSFGNPTRIDYGTGHETNFCVLLYCLARLERRVGAKAVLWGLHIFMSACLYF